MKKGYLFGLIALVALILAAHPALAQELTDPLGGVSIPVLIGRVIRVALGISGSVALLMFIYGGFIWLTSGGKPEAIEKGKKTLIWAVIGLAIIFTSYLAVDQIIRALSSGETSGAEEALRQLSRRLV
jgi:hypothetical protein